MLIDTFIRVILSIMRLMALENLVIGCKMSKRKLIKN